MKIGVDLGYSHVKAETSNGKKATFASLVGTPAENQFDTTLPANTFAIEYNGTPRLVGAGVSSQSRYSSNKKDRGWVTSEEYQALFLTAITQLSRGSKIDIDAVTGLPVNFMGDKAAVKENLLGEHRIKIDGKTQVLNIRSCKVVPQPFGSVFSLTLNGFGKAVENTNLLQGMVGVVDVGSKTTNILTIDRMRDVGIDSLSINSGGWKVTDAVKRKLIDLYDFDHIDDYQVAQAIVDRKISYYSGSLDIADMVESEIKPLADEILSAMKTLWNKGERLKGIILTGGGSLLLDDLITEKYPHIIMMDDPIHANAHGYYLFSCRK